MTKRFSRKWQPLQPESAFGSLFRRISSARAARIASTGRGPPSYSHIGT